MCWGHPGAPPGVWKVALCFCFHSLISLNERIKFNLKLTLVDLMVREERREKERKKEERMKMRRRRREKERKKEEREGEEGGGERGRGRRRRE